MPLLTSSTHLAAQASAGLCDIPGAELAMPGPFDYAAGVSWMRHKLPYLYGVNLREALAPRFGWQAGQVRFLNDAAASCWARSARARPAAFVAPSVSLWVRASAPALPWMAAL